MCRKRDSYRRGRIRFVRDLSRIRAAKCPLRYGVGGPARLPRFRAAGRETIDVLSALDEGAVLLSEIGSALRRIPNHPVERNVAHGEDIM